MVRNECMAIHDGTTYGLVTDLASILVQSIMCAGGGFCEISLMPSPLFPNFGSSLLGIELKIDI